MSVHKLSSYRVHEVSQQVGKKWSLIRDDRHDEGETKSAAHLGAYKPAAANNKNNILKISYNRCVLGQETKPFLDWFANVNVLQPTISDDRCRLDPRK